MGSSKRSCQCSVAAALLGGAVPRRRSQETLDWGLGGGREIWAGITERVATKCYWWFYLLEQCSEKLHLRTDCLECKKENGFIYFPSPIWQRFNISAVLGCAVPGLKKSSLCPTSWGWQASPGWEVRGVRRGPEAGLWAGHLAEVVGAGGRSGQVVNTILIPHQLPDRIWRGSLHKIRMMKKKIINGNFKKDLSFLFWKRRVIVVLTRRVLAVIEWIQEVNIYEALKIYVAYKSHYVDVCF